LTLAEIPATTIGMKVESFKSSLAANKDRSISAIFRDSLSCVRGSNQATFGSCPKQPSAEGP